MLKSLEELKRTRGECLEGLERKGDLSFLQRIDTSIYRHRRAIETKEKAEKNPKSTRSLGEPSLSATAGFRASGRARIHPEKIGHAVAAMRDARK